jgi:protein-tyrosine phosphatase
MPDTTTARNAATMIGAMTSLQWLPLDGAVNARVVVPGVLLRSDNLQGLSQEDVARLVGPEAVGVVLDLRTAVEVRSEGPGPLVGHPRVRIEHRSLHPESGERTDLDADTVKPWGRMDVDPTLAGEPSVVRTYMAYLHHRPDSIVDAIRTIARSERAVLVHCAAGKDRTGVVVALALDGVGVDRSAIVADYAASGERIEAIFERLTSSETYRAELQGHDPREGAPESETMQRFLEIVDERHGGSVRWLQANGLSHTDLQSLRKRLAPDGWLGR